MRPLTLTSLAIAAAFLSPATLAGPGGGQGAPGHGYGSGAYVAPGHGAGGAHWGGGAYRPGHWPGYGYGYGGWRVGYPGYGYGYGNGWGWGLGYGAGWALAAASPWYWGGPAAVYGMPAFYPYGYFAAPGYAASTLNEELAYVQQAPVEPVAPPPGRKALGLWYYCTEPAGYHPYVAQCTRPWIAVQPQATPSTAP
jgi:hypothetical protein